MGWSRINAIIGDREKDGEGASSQKTRCAVLEFSMMFGSIIENSDLTEIEFQIKFG